MEAGRKERRKGGRERGREEGRKEGREGGREAGREEEGRKEGARKEGREGGREGGRKEGGREEGRKGGGKGGRKKGRKDALLTKQHSLQFRSSDMSPQSSLPSQKADSRMQCFLYGQNLLPFSQSANIMYSAVTVSKQKVQHSHCLQR